MIVVVKMSDLEEASVKCFDVTLSKNKAESNSCGCSVYKRVRGRSGSVPSFRLRGKVVLDNNPCIPKCSTVIPTCFCSDEVKSDWSKKL